MPPPVRAQLDLPEKQGLLVVSVVPDSPAAKAGIVRHDVLLRAGDKPLADPRQLVQAIEATKEGKLKIELLHDGKPKTVEVTPAKRPEEARRPGGEKSAADWETMQNWLQGMWSNGEGGGDGLGPLKFRIIRPGAIVPGDVLVTEPLPPNMSIVITKEGDHPAKIVVKRGNEKWELTEKELDKLPADVRPHVERLLGRGLRGIVGPMASFNFDQNVPAPGDQGPPPAAGSAAQPRGPEPLDRMERRFDEMNRRMDRLLKAVEEMSENSAHHPASEKSAEQPPQK